MLEVLVSNVERVKEVQKRMRNEKVKEVSEK